MNLNSGELNLFTFFNILKKNFLKILIIPLIFTGISYLILILYDINFEESSSKVKLTIYESNYLKKDEIYNYNILLSRSFQDIIAYQTFQTVDKNSQLLNSIVDKDLIIGFNANKLLNSLTLIENRNIYFLSNSLINYTKFYNYLAQNIADNIKLNRFKNFLANLEILKTANKEDKTDNSIYKKLIITSEIKETENILKDTNEFLFHFEKFLNTSLLEDFDQFISYYSLIINNQLENNKKNSLKKEIQIKKQKERIEILKENINISKNLETVDKKDKLDLIWEMTVSSRTFDYASIDYTDFPLYVFGTEFLQAEIARIELNILRLLKDDYNIEENDVAVSKKYLSDLKINFNNIQYLNKNHSYFEYDFDNVYSNNKIANINYILILYLFSLLILIFYYVLNFIYLSNQNK
tara:strand:+ start:468 stop:1697 length:1230 start_codon:yes stop_codon:yes gene_type:complete